MSSSLIRKIATNRLTVMGVALCICIFAFLLFNTITQFLIMFPLFLWALSETQRKNAEEAIESTFLNLNVICEGRQYLGGNSQVVDTIMQRSGFDRRVKQLCLTNNGNWFGLSFNILNGSSVATDVKISAFDTTEAKEWLAKSPELYQKHFGVPEIA